MEDQNITPWDVQQNNFITFYKSKSNLNPLPKILNKINTKKQNNPHLNQTIIQTNNAKSLNMSYQQNIRQKVRSSGNYQIKKYLNDEINKSNRTSRIGQKLIQQLSSSQKYDKLQKIYKKQQKYKIKQNNSNYIINSIINESGDNQLNSIYDNKQNKNNNSRQIFDGVCIAEKSLYQSKNKIKKHLEQLILKSHILQATSNEQNKSKLRFGNILLYDKVAIKNHIKKQSSANMKSSLLRESVSLNASFRHSFEKKTQKCHQKQKKSCKGLKKEAKTNYQRERNSMFNEINQYNLFNQPKIKRKLLNAKRSKRSEAVSFNN